MRRFVVAITLVSCALFFANAMAQQRVAEQQLQLQAEPAKPALEATVTAPEVFFGARSEEMKKIPLSQNILSEEKLCPAKQQRFMSDKAEDYSLTFIPTDDGSMSLAVIYGRLADGVTLSSLETASNYDFVKDNKLWNTQIGNEKIFIWFLPQNFMEQNRTQTMWTYALMQTFLNKPLCESLAKKEGDTKGDIFRCVYSLAIKGKPEDLAKKALESQGKLWISAVNIYCPAPLQPLADMINRVVDEDKDAVPDDLDNCAKVANYSQENLDKAGSGDACQALDECTAKLAEADAAKTAASTESMATVPVPGTTATETPSTGMQFAGSCSLIK